ncbi:MAG: fatty acid desaturase [Hyphomicrobiaceae bacterium]
MSREADADRSTILRQSQIGLALCATIISGWAALHVYAVFLYDWGQHSYATAPALSMLICWLYVGLFIIAHDCMHGSLVPWRPAWNSAIGRLCLTLYAGFDFDQLNRKHHLHHRHSGTADDPDFDATPPHGLWHWYINFIREYFSWRELVFLTVITGVYVFVLEVRYLNLLVFWALPAMLSSFQLFYFGTYLPHRPRAQPFVDRHRARDIDFGWLQSLLTCFHFGYHHDHHLAPKEPWWRLPRVRTSRLESDQA